MALELIILQQPHEVSFSGNPLPYTFAFTPYGVPEQQQDIKIQMRIEIEDSHDSNVFREIYSKIFYPNPQGTAQIDISSIVDAYVKYYVPKPNLIRCIQANGQFKRFRIIVVATKDGQLLTAPVTSDVISVIKGGLSYEHWTYKDFFEETVKVQKKALHFFTADEMFHASDKRYLSWVCPTGDARDQIVWITINYANGTTFTDYISSKIPTRLWAVFICPIGYDQIRTMLHSDPPDLTPISYTAWVITEDDEMIVDEVTFFIEQRNYYEGKQLIYNNSLGGLETLPILGEVDYAAEYNTTQANRITPPSGIESAMLVPQVVTMQNEETEKFNGNTNFISKEKLNRIRDLFLSTNVYEIKYNRFLPVIVNKKTAKFYSNKDRLVGMAIEWQHAWANNYYTPNGTIPTNVTCPALQLFEVRQVTKNTLRILWAMPMPYDLLEVEIDNGTPAELTTLTLQGNTGSQIVSFINPAVYPDDADITIKGRVICNSELLVFETGIYSDVTLSVYANTLPIANDDTFSLAAGYTDPQVITGNVLDNDYDPDGDAIEVVPAVGATTAGGTYEIFADGTFEYQAPTSIFNGVDTFDYTIQEVATPAMQDTATVRINVGNVYLGSSVFIKITERNHYENTPDNTVLNYRSEGDFFLTYWADPQGTIPKDITGLALTVNYKLVEDQHLLGVTGSIIASSTTDYSTPGTGTELFIGHLITQQLIGYVPQRTLVTKYQMRPGTGYTAI